MNRTSTGTMIHNGLSCRLHMPKATRSQYGERGAEVTQGLAPSAPINVFSVDAFLNCPDDWKRSDPGKNIASYFVPVTPGHMVWFDLNENGTNSHDVAAIISAQRVNGISGRPIMEEDGLTQYHHTCPIHHERFANREKLCVKCGFEWPHQNYIATTSVMRRQFWRDGFRGGDGKTREFVFTEDMARGVAANIIGEERTNAFGIALHLSQNPKPPAPYRPVYRGMDSADMLGGSKGVLESFGATRSMNMAPPIEVGAGATVDQVVERDEKRLDFWMPEPAAFFIVYYVGQEQFRHIVGENVVGATNRRGDGFLGNIPTGNK